MGIGTQRGEHGREACHRVVVPGHVGPSVVIGRHFMDDTVLVSLCKPGVSREHAARGRNAIDMDA